MKKNDDNVIANGNTKLIFIHNCHQFIIKIVCNREIITKTVKAAGSVIRP